MLRIGGVLAAIGIAGFVCCFVTFYQVFDGPAPFWFQLITLTAALVPLGAITAFAGAAICIGRATLGRGGNNSN
jgi:hypothetical protein